MFDSIYITVLMSGVVFFVAGFAIHHLIISAKEKNNLSKKSSLAKQIVDRAKRDADKIIESAKSRSSEVTRKNKHSFEKMEKDKRREFSSLEQDVRKKSESVNKKLQEVADRETEMGRRQQSLNSLEQSLKERHSEIDQIKSDMTKRLEEISGLSAEEIKREMLETLEAEAKKEASLRVREIQEDAEQGAKEAATKAIALAVHRYAGKYTAENTSSTVTLPDPNIKGKIIGREGRNIRALEVRTGVDFVIDDSPDTVVLTSLNSLRREIAVVSLKRLIDDGRVHPGRIEEVVSDVEQEINEEIKKAGEGAVLDLGIHDMDPELVRHVGMLKYRRSYAQNMLNHSIEVAFICGMLAAEIGYDQNRAKRAALLHDVGKAVDHEVEGSHVEIGAELARKYKEAPEVVKAVEQSHDSRVTDVLSILVQAADTISASRPGARKESFEKYIKRVEEIEEIGNSFTGVSKCFAIQAGRELRVIVENSALGEDESESLSRDIAKKIQDEVTYPGKIKVTVIRETRAVAFAS
ncbi:MAG: ribonuclease Y [Candidatus Mycalebacterium zealandia]|nr:MAG: ribonuclease Y [Candidatus Mycalebacterium zealandia]